MVAHVAEPFQLLKSYWGMKLHRKNRAAKSDIDPWEARRMRGILLNLKYLDDPFPDEEKAGIASVTKEEAFVVLLDDDCRNISEAGTSFEWPDWEGTMQTKLDQLKRMKTRKLIEKPLGVVPIGNKWMYAKKRNKEGRLIKYKAGQTSREGLRAKRQV